MDGGLSGGVERDFGLCRGARRDAKPCRSTGAVRDYCLELLMPIERKSVEPMAAVTAPWAFSPRA